MNNYLHIIMSGIALFLVIYMIYFVFKMVSKRHKSDEEGK